ncbi:hypothetical protein OsJ_34060 [Oryza sativa Japonica Group]|uniref:Uncharacterized protein n=3 Tax=Oryza TaxID=4527 RepID=A0A8J8YCA2_ORYSJ|nr:hypothetical protein LOC_Os11g31930 [Oryza sativa Japonica Group]EAZ18531.1 hypothetical protein OsJ_34060 [Oryza sativa Japonica Group]
MGLEEGTALAFQSVRFSSPPLPPLTAIASASTEHLRKRRRIGEECGGGPRSVALRQGLVAAFTSTSHIRSGMRRSRIYFQDEDNGKKMVPNF